MLHVTTRPLKFAITLMVTVVTVISTLIAVNPAKAQTAQEAFIQKLVPGALRSWNTYRVPPSVTLSQAILETGWGKSELASKYNNYFGIKCSTTKSPYQSGCADIPTTEYDSNGNKYTVVASFRTYADPGMSMIDHGYFLSVNSRYRPAFAYSNQSVKFAKAIQVAGYATDPNYAHLLYKIMSTYNLFQYDQGKSLGSAPDPAGTAPAAATTAAPAVKKSTRQKVATVKPAATPTPEVTKRKAAQAAAVRAPAPKATAPKATAPKATAPKATAPKATAPKATAPKATVPATVAPSDQHAATTPAGDQSSSPPPGLPDTGR